MNPKQPPQDIEQQLQKWLRIFGVGGPDMAWEYDGYRLTWRGFRPTELHDPWKYLKRDDPFRYLKR